MCEPDAFVRSEMRSATYLAVATEAIEYCQSLGHREPELLAAMWKQRIEKAAR